MISSRLPSLLAVLCTVLVSADIPVHCLHKHIVGDWVFHRSAAGQQYNSMSACSKAGSYLGGGDFELGEPAYTVLDQVHVTLASPNKASAKIDGKIVHGTWTMMYDEGFEVLLGEQKYFAFSKYTGSHKHTVSHCDKTFPGWFHADPESKTWGCYHGTKTTPVAPQAFRRFGEGKSIGFKRDMGGDIVAPRGDVSGHEAMHAMPTASQDAAVGSGPGKLGLGEFEDFADFESLVQTEATAASEAEVEALSQHVDKDFYQTRRMW